MGEPKVAEKSRLARELAGIPLSLVFLGLGLLGSVHVAGPLAGSVIVPATSVVQRNYMLAILYGIDLGAGVFFGSLVIPTQSGLTVPLLPVGPVEGNLGAALAFGLEAALLGCAAVWVVNRMFK